MAGNPGVTALGRRFNAAESPLPRRYRRAVRFTERPAADPTIPRPASADRQLSCGTPEAGLAGVS